MFQTIRREILKPAGKMHLAETFRWATNKRIEPAEALAAGLGMAGPVLLAVMGGHLAPGLAAAIGALAVSGVEIGSSVKAQAKAEIAALAPAALATLFSVLIGGFGWSTVAMLVLLAVVAATIGGYSHFMSVVTTRFILFLTIVSAVASASSSLEGPRAAGLLLLVVVGGLWTAALRQLFGALLRVRRSVVSPIAGGLVPTVAASQKFRRWRRSLAHFAGWQYALRLASGLGVAAALRSLWPDHHLHWIALTVAILTPRKIEPVPVKMTQRALGTAIGVGAASLLMTFELPPWALVVVIGLLAGARPLLKARNYLAYSALMTPLIIIIMDAGQPCKIELLIQRLVATLIGALLVTLISLVFRRMISFGAMIPLPLLQKWP